MSHQLKKQVGLAYMLENMDEELLRIAQIYSTTTK